MTAVAAAGGCASLLAVVLAAASVFFSGPPLLVRAARALAVIGLLIGGAGLLQELLASGFQLAPQRGGMGHGSLLASGGMLLLTFGAARVAERRRAARDRERFLAEQREKRGLGASGGG